MDFERLSISRHRRDRGVQCPARVDDEHIAGGEPAWQIGEPRMVERVGVEIGDEQSYVIPPETTRLRRFSRFERRRQLEVRHDTCCSHRASSR